jgi:Predicted transcriptional regulators
LKTCPDVPFNARVNDRLRTVMLQRGVSTEKVADECQVDPKTVERWINPGRVPHRRHRWQTATLLGVDEAYLWPSVLEEPGRRSAAVSSELIEVYPDRASVERQTWLRLLCEARERVDVLVFAGTFIAQSNPRVAEMLAERAASGVKVRLCFGDPGTQAVQVRDDEERLRGTLASKIRASLTYFQDLPSVDGCEVRLHGSTLYASMFRYDGDMLVNPHVYGLPASANPLLHLRRLDAGGWFDRYADSFDAVWAGARPWDGYEEMS